VNFIPLKVVLKKVLAEKKMSAKFTAAEICTVAGKLFAAELPALANKFTIKFIKDGILNIAVTSSAVSSEMRLAETNVLDTLNKRKAGIKSVRYQVGPLPEKITPY